MRSLLMRAAMLRYRARHWTPLVTLAQEPAQAQAATLRRILEANQSTQFGAAHGFATVRTPTDYQARVDVQQYESLRELIERQRLTGAPTLTTEAPIFYARTSGSTGVPKLIPITATALRLHRDEQALFTYLQHRACPEAFAGSAWGIMGAAVEGRLDSGHAVGSVSGHLYESLPRLLQSRFVVPPVVSGIDDYDTRYLVILRLALATADITYLGAPNPSTFVRLLHLLNTRRDVLARSLESGRLTDLGSIGDTIGKALGPRLAADRGRANALRHDRPLTFTDLWPHIRLLTTWTGGSCGIALDALRRALPDGCSVMELGYQATEMRGTLALDREAPGGLPPLDHHFFEFVDQERWESGDPAFLGVADLESDRRYYVLVTTAAGLYRYFMNDLVEVAGRFGNTPLLRFVQKGKGVTSLTGEKLYEAQVIAAVTDAARARGLTPAFFQMLADETQSRYRLMIEVDQLPPADFAADVDVRLGELNVEYQAKRASQRLGPPTVSRLRPGSWEAYKAACLARGQREGQFKPSILQYERDLVWPVEDHVID